jgi:hypothetical protein
MRKLFFAVLLLMATAPGQAEEVLTTLEKSFVVNMTAAFTVPRSCDAPTLISGGLDRLANRLNDGDRLFQAVLAALAVQEHTFYDHSDLVPALTRFVLETHATITEGLRRDKAKTCGMFMKMLRENGVVE